jgi:hypothetical protein
VPVAEHSTGGGTVHTFPTHGLSAQLPFTHPEAHFSSTLTKTHLPIGSQVPGVAFRTKVFSFLQNALGAFSQLIPAQGSLTQRSFKQSFMQVTATLTN